MDTEVSLADAALESWDAVIIGCGLAGATFALGLARRGQRVLVLDAGLGPDAPEQRATYPEMTRAFPNALASQLAAETLLLHGRQTSAIDDYSAKRSHSFVPFIGKGAGGSSRLYGMAMERFLPQDFESLSEHPLAASRMEAWPLAYDTLVPWYEEAEVLYSVRGERDPLTGKGRSPLPSLEPMDIGHRWLREALGSNGVHPYRLPLACREVNACRSCQGHLCTQSCKVSSVEACLAPAFATGHTHTIFSCTAVRLEANHDRVTAVLCEQRGERHLLKAGKFVLGLGALYSPALLLRSASADWPDGLANSSGWVGRGLMRHGIDLYAVTLPEKHWQETDNRRKTLAFNDLYAGPDGGLGTVQSFGRLPPTEMLSSQLVADLTNKLPALPQRLFELGSKALSPILRGLEARSLVLAATMEDSADYGNWIKPSLSSPDPAAIQLRYKLTSRDRHRMGVFRQKMSRILRGLSVQKIWQMENNERIAHACGTCRAGQNPASSVVDADNRAHGLDNLWVCDASFMPSSGGTNPSLTIAANALRVSASI